MVFVPADPPRAGAFAVCGEGPDEVELVLPAGSTVRRRKVAAHLVPLRTAISELPQRCDGDHSASLAAWSAAITAGLGIIGRGRLLPARSAAGYDTWRAGPLDSADVRWLDALAAAMPADAHALPVPGSRPIRLHSPETLVRALWDAIADTMVRTPAAEVAGRPMFAATAPTPVDGAAVDWLTEVNSERAAGAKLVLRLEQPAKEDEPFAAVLALRSVADPSLVVDAERLWDAPAAVLSRLGQQAETDLLLALRRGARAFAPVGRTLAAATPTALLLDEDEVAELLDSGADALGGAGIEVLWPFDMFADLLGLQATAAQTPAPG
ncbi:MAG: ATP-dependent helicase, partial [Sciscionella sp.]